MRATSTGIVYHFIEAFTRRDERGYGASERWPGGRTVPAAGDEIKQWPPCRQRPRYFCSRLLSYHPTDWTLWYSVYFELGNATTGI